MDPWQSWTIAGVVGIGAAYYYTQSSKSKRGRGRPSPIVTPEQSQRRRSKQRSDSKDKRKKKGKSSDTSDQPGSDVADVSSASVQTVADGTVKKRKGGKRQPSKLAQSSAVEITPEQRGGAENDVAEDEGLDNEEFARQLSGLKAGVSLKKSATQNEMKKMRKQGKRNEVSAQAMNGSALQPNGVASSQDMSTASSTTGADADDDLSPAMSPDLRAIQATSPSAMDVSDMLEPVSKGPSVLRITEPVNSQPARQPKAQKPAAEPETKKQRQNRQKNEEKKAMREQAEKERRVLLEKQLRTAREAEGRPAKNGINPRQLPHGNAWDKPITTANDSTGPTPKDGSPTLLDTYEDTPTLNLNPPHPANDTSADRKAWNNDLPSEEDQIRMISEMDSDNAWSTVAKGGKKKKSSAATLAVKETTKSSGNQKQNVSSANTESLANPGTIDKNDSKGNDSNNHEPSKVLATSTDHNNASSNGAEKEGILNAGIPAKEGKMNKTANPRANNSGGHPAHGETPSSHEPKRIKATYETIDHNVWTRENIAEHPDFDPDFPYALTGHPGDDEWAVC